MRDIIEGYAKQFAYAPTIVNGVKLKPSYDSYVIVGMGGSHLAADLLRTADPRLPITIHRDYGLPATPIENALIVCMSYSGNTEEVISALEEAERSKLPAIVITSGGVLLDTAKSKHLPYVALPALTIQPRMATGYMLKALLALFPDSPTAKQTESVAATLDPRDEEAQGKAFAKSLIGYIPIIYASYSNRALAWNWKVKFNENAKIPAFANEIPESNHNEMTGFAVEGEAQALAANFHFLLLRDNLDNPRILKRMQLLAELYEKRGLKVLSIELTGKTALEKIVRSVSLADWTTYHTALLYETDPASVPLVETFKKLLSG